MGKSIFKKVPDRIYGIIASALCFLMFANFISMFVDIIINQYSFFNDNIMLFINLWGYPLIFYLVLGSFMPFYKQWTKILLTAWLLLSALRDLYIVTTTWESFYRVLSISAGDLYKKYITYEQFTSIMHNVFDISFPSNIQVIFSAYTAIILFLFSVFSWKKTKSRNYEILMLPAFLYALLDVCFSFYSFSEFIHTVQFNPFDGNFIYLLYVLLVCIWFLKLSQRKSKEYQETTRLDPYGYCSLGEHILVTCIAGAFPFVYRMTMFFKKKKGIAVGKTLLSLFVPLYYYFWIYNTAKKAECYAQEKGVRVNLAVKTLWLSILLGAVGPIYLQHKINKLITLTVQEEEVSQDIEEKSYTVYPTQHTEMKRSENEVFTVRRFGADPFALSELENNKTKQVISIIAGIVVFIIAICLGNAQENAWYDSSEYNFYRTIKIICILLGIILVGFSAVIWYISDKSRQALSLAHVTLFEDRIEGMSVVNGEGTAFMVAWEDVVCAYNDVDCLVIKTVIGNKKCYGIENASILNKMINSRVAELTSNVQPETTVAKEENDEQLVNEGNDVQPISEEINNQPESQETEAVAEIVQNTVDEEKTPETLKSEFKFCMNCGEKLPANARFCKGCGEKQEG